MKFHSLNSVEDYLYSLPIQKRNPEERLAYVKEVLRSLGSPQNNAPAIHIAGTSGKGSTAYFTSSLLVESGYSVGLIVSPHVHTVKERAQINGEPLSDEDYINYINQFVDIIDNKELSYIEFLIVFSFWLFAQLNVQYMVIEVGMGGRLDPTNTLSRPKTVRGITDIGLDHMEFLGTTLSAIAGEKAGIIHEGDFVIMNSQTSEVIDTIKQKAASMKANLDILPVIPASKNISMPSYQKRNWQLALALASKRLEIDNQPAVTSNAIKKSQQVTIPGRFERRALGETPIILDAAHNPQKITALVDSLKQNNPSKRPITIVAFGKNKADSAQESLSILETISSRIIATEFQIEFSGDHSSLSAQEVANFHRDNKKIAIEPVLRKAVERALVEAKEHDTYVVVTGSFYLLDNIYKLFKEF